MKTLSFGEKDKYGNFAELEKCEQKGAAYSVVHTHRNSDTLILVPHGGGIEPGTSEIGRAIAGLEYSLYLFEGLKHSHNRALHITSTDFDEPIALAMVKRSTRTIAVHGCNAMTNTVYVGGRDTSLVIKIIKALNEATIGAEQSSNPKFQGMYPENICNCNRTSKGVQLEIPKILRQQMFVSLSRSGREEPTRLFFDFVRAVRGCLAREKAGSG